MKPNEDLLHIPTGDILCGEPVTLPYTDADWEKMDEGQIVAHFAPRCQHTALSEKHRQEMVEKEAKARAKAEAKAAKEAEKLAKAEEKARKTLEREAAKLAKEQEKLEKIKKKADKL